MYVCILIIFITVTHYEVHITLMVELYYNTLRYRTAVTKFGCYAVDLSSGKERFY